MSFQPGPSSIEYQTAYAPGAPVGKDLYDRKQWFVDIHRESKDRIQETTHVINGHWSVVWPNLTTTAEAPTVANIAEMVVNHWSAVFGAMLPTLRVPLPYGDTAKGGKRSARKRERRVRELWENSNLSELMAMAGGDYAGAGFAILGAWVNFEEEDPTKRNPFIVRFDPRHTYPIKDDNGNITELLVARRVSRPEFDARYPQWRGTIAARNGEVLEEWFWMTKDRFMFVIADASPGASTSGRSVVLVNEENPLGFVPVAEAVRPTFDGQRRGVVDQTIHIMRTMHRLMALTIMATEEDVFPPVLEYDILNPEDFGPAATLHARSPQATLTRVGPTGKFDVKDLIARLGDEARQNAAFPQQLTGDPGASIVSARGIKASMGQLDARLAVAHKQFETLLTKVSAYLLAMDETFCKGDKTIYGTGRDRKAEAWNPEKDVAGQWDVVVTYGIGVGSDPASKEMRLAMWQANKTLSMETTREELDFVPDGEAEGIRQAREEARQAIQVGILQRAVSGDVALAARFLTLLRDEEGSIDEAFEKIVDEMQGPSPASGMMPPGMGGGGDPMAALQQAESLARGGIPGNAEQGPPVNAGLPPLDKLLSGPRQVV